MDCIFCKICSGTIPAKKLHEDDRAVVFADIAPAAPTHFLVVPKQHVVSLAHTAHEDASLLGHLLAIATEQAAAHRLTQGFRVVINSGPDGGQTVDHLHVHVLGGRQMHWPPG